MYVCIDCIAVGVCFQQSGDRVVRPPSYHSTGEPAVKYSVVKQQDVDNGVPPPAYISDGK